MMDNPTANKSHIPCQAWAGQNGWSAASSQGLINPLTSSQQLSLGMASGQRPSYNHLQASSQSCMSDLSTLSSRNSLHHTPLYRAPHISGVSSSTALFSNTSVPGASHMTAFAQQGPHTSSILMTANQGKNMPTPSHPQPDQRPEPCRAQHLPPLSQHQVSFQTPLTSQGLPSGLQDLTVSLPSCGQHEQPQWMPSSHCRGGVSESVPAAHPDKEPLQDGNVLPLMSNDRRRSVLLHQRSQLLKQLAEMDKILESLPPEDSRDGHSPHTAAQSSPSVDDSSRCEQMKTSDAHQGKSHPSSPSFYEEENETCDSPEDVMSAAESAKEDNASAESWDDSDPDYLPDSDADVSDRPSKTKTKDYSSDEISHGSPSTPTGQRPPLPEEEGCESESSVSKEESVTPPKKPRENNRKKLSETLVLPVSSSKAQRVYDKRNYCLFCSKPVLKMSRHLERLHSDRAEVAAAFQFPKHSRERRKIHCRLINQGNFKHNKNVLKTGDGQLVVRKRPKRTAQAQDFLHCLYCQGLYVKKALSRHMKKCPEKEKNADECDISRRRVASRCMLQTVNCEDLGISDSVKNIIGEMVYDEVTQAVIGDRIIRQYAEQMFDQYGRDVQKHHYIRQNLRQVGRLVLEAQKITPMQSLEDFFYPSNFRHVVSAVNVLAGYDSERKTYSTPSLALKLGYNLQKTCSIVEANAVKSGDAKLAESAKNFLSVYQKKWNKLISSGALTTLKETKLHSEKQVPFVQDVKRLHFHLENSHHAAEQKLRESPSAESYAALARVVLTRIIIFNRRKPREVSSIPLTAFMSRKKSDVLDDMDVSVSDLERTMCRFFVRVDVRGQCGRMVPVLLKPSFVSALELLVNVREACGVPNKNPFLFGRPSVLSAYKGTEMIQRFVKHCGAQNPKALTSRKIRKHFATMLQLITLDDNEAHQILGPNNQVQVLRQHSDSMLDDAEMEVGARPRPAGRRRAASWDHSGSSSAGSSVAAELYRPPACGAATSATAATPSRCVASGKQDSHCKTKHKWEEAEVRAVERHMMRFIQGHKVPQKDDCIQCLEAEPKALRTRSWKGVKDYVRNRITALKRQSGHSRKSSKKS
ncbi:uncharacterized protein LOC103362345 [Stegastes partitus]|uniref:Uncharacterized protein LOC103362345 n=1 Tax=Stegastes partitus TaxID=144197 RepID=A0A9Y4K5A3_9TELE|nr:PREDICTED: uncharacterized protein LOC103362345 [Stegastes partitus]XP_008286894.1 PREDICTED: uncharacterized protein LOC103362345 [Stegastes partitus]XP_008286895.1 PREDICTED: uncharacterized protein LOC103362345 [Stegastes partitus]XP_008286896.1 PREDICTED: uncharacterized protein LOC103362345 [Stegastes partitus]